MTKYTRREISPGIPDERDYQTGITDEEIEAAHAEISQRLQNLHRGGYSLSGEGEHSPRVSVTLPRDVHDSVEAHAAAAGMSVSKYLRRLIIEHEHAA
ncbi:hypothetical protein GCM10027059_02130 [Myceligenerans halotolerans]